MGKPSQTNATTTAINPVQTAQQPYLNYGWGQAQDLYKNNPQQYYPGQTMAPWMAPNPAQTQGYQDLYNTAANVQGGMFPTANTAWQQAAGGQYGGQANPAYGGYAQLAGGSGPTMENYQALQNAAREGGAQYGSQVGQYANPLAGFAQQAGANSNLGLSQLGQTASGAYVGQNPYLASAVEAAQRPTQQAYRTSVAPSIDAAASAAGRYGSGATAGQRSTAELNLASALGDIGTKMSYENLARERGAQDAAARSYAELQNQGLDLGMRGYRSAADVANAAGNQYFAGQNAAQTAANAYGAAQQSGLTGLSNAFNTGTQASLEALRQYPQLQQAAYAGPQATISAGQGLSALDQQYRGFLQQQIQDQMARYYGVQQAPWETLKQYSGLIGPSVGGSESKTTPYFSNPVGSAISGLSGLAGIASSPAAGALMAKI